MNPKRRIKWVFGTVLLLVVLPFLLSLTGFFAWSPINCWQYEVDIHTGRVQYTRYFAFIPVKQGIEESTLSAVLRPEDYAELEPDWRRVNTFSPGVSYSPHYAFHSAQNQIRKLELLWQMGGFTPAARRASARRILQLWQEGQGDDAAETYLRILSGIAVKSGSEQRETNEGDLPLEE